MHHEKQTFFKIFFTLTLLAALPITFALTNSSRKTQDVRSKAARIRPVSNKIFFLPFSFSKDKSGEKILKFEEKVKVRNGFVSSPQTTVGPQFTATLLDLNGSQIAEQKFLPPHMVAIDSFDKKSGKEKAELKEVAANNLGLSLPYHPSAEFIQIRNVQGVVVKTISLRNTTSQNNPIDLKEMYGDKLDEYRNMMDNNLFNELNPWQIKKVLAASGTFNIAIIGDNYAGDNLRFQNDVNDIASGLLSIEPFKSYQANIVFYPQLSTVAICSFTGSNLSCNDTLALQEASSVPYDKIYVLYDGPYAGFAYVGATLSYGTTANDMTTAVKKSLFVHELAGHALGGLMDEYSYGTTGASYAPNCSDNSSCPSWYAITGLGCFATCGFTNLYRATDNASVMNTALLQGTLTFDAYSTQVVNGKLTAYFTASTPTPTLPPIPTPTPTLTPSPTVSTSTTPLVSPSITPTPTHGIGVLFLADTPTPNPTILPTITPSSTPAPTQILSCSFPNFCTQTKYCATENILPIGCGGSDEVCCQVQIQPTDTPLSPQGIESTPTPTIFQRFDPLPTLPDSNGTYPTQTPTPTIAQIISVIPSPSPYSVINIFTSPTITTVEPLPSVTGTFPTQYNAPLPQPSPTTIQQEIYQVYPTPTKYEIENLVFERPTPTPPPKVGIFDILAVPSRFINNLVLNFFSIFSKR